MPLQDQKNYYDENQKAQAAQTFQQAQCGVAAANHSNSGLHGESLATRLSLRFQLAQADQSKVSRALNILQLHPEFEDFLWLLRSGVV